MATRALGASAIRSVNRAFGGLIDSDNANEERTLNTFFDEDFETGTSSEDQTEDRSYVGDYGRLPAIFLLLISFAAILIVAALIYCRKHRRDEKQKEASMMDMQQATRDRAAAPPIESQTFASRGFGDHVEADPEDRQVQLDFEDGRMASDEPGVETVRHSRNRLRSQRGVDDGLQFQPTMGRAHLKDDRDYVDDV